MHFYEDGWGNTGELNMTFLEDTVKVTVEFEDKAPFAKWGLQDSELKFYFKN